MNLFGRLLLPTLIGLAGCAAPLPTYPDSTPDQAALQIIAERLEGCRTLVSEGETKLTAPDGRSVHFETAIAARFPRELRLQAWKFSTLVLDLTVLPDASYLYISEEANADPGLQPAATDLSHGTRFLSGEFFRGAKPMAGESTPQTLVATGPGPRGKDARCEIDRATLTPRRFQFLGSAASLELNRYEMIKEVPWPREIRLLSTAGEVTITLRNPELNTEVPDRAFTPPRRARQLP